MQGPGLDSSNSGPQQVAGCCEHGYEQSGPTWSPVFVK
jgi:hypothetical protein